VGSSPYLTPVTVLTRLSTVFTWFLYMFMALRSLKKSSHCDAVDDQFVYVHL
jgi:hypothetical protein